MARMMLALEVSAMATGELFLARPSSGCLGGSLSACLAFCDGAEAPASVRDACARGCRSGCPAPAPAPPMPAPAPQPSPPAPTPAPSPPAPQPSPTPAPLLRTDVWFGEGCFWERQYAYTLVELDPAGAFRRSDASVTSVAGYAGSLATAAGQVCYEAASNVTSDYGELGHAEQVRITLDEGQEEQQFAALVRGFFASFNATEQGFERPDPQNKGSPYRTTVGIPGGVHGQLYSVLVAANMPRGPYNLTMSLKEDIAGSQDDAFNTVFVMDSDAFPFYLAEQYHQFHSDIYSPGSNGTYYPDWYRHELWQLQIDLGRIPFGGSTSCPDNRLKHY